MVVKRASGRREPFDRSKVEQGVRQATRKRPISQTQIAAVIDELEEQATLEGRDSHEIASTRIGELILQHLRRLDRVAYIRFASVYRNFEDVAEFVQEIERLDRDGE